MPPDVHPGPGPAGAEGGRRKSEMTRKRAPGRRREYRKPNYNSAIRIACLVDHLPHHDLGMRLSSVAEYLGVSEQTVRRYIKALNDEFQTEDGEPQFFIEVRGEEKWLCRRDRFSEPADAHIYQLISVYLSLEIFESTFDFTVRIFSSEKIICCQLYIRGADNYPCHG